MDGESDENRQKITLVLLYFATTKSEVVLKYIYIYKQHIFHLQRTQEMTTYKT